jgi:hypothetical protein
LSVVGVVNEGCDPADSGLSAVGVINGGGAPADGGSSAGCAPANSGLSDGCAPANSGLGEGCAPADRELRAGCAPAVKWSGAAGAVVAANRCSVGSGGACFVVGGGTLGGNEVRCGDGTGRVAANEATIPRRGNSPGGKEIKSVGKSVR